MRDWADDHAGLAATLYAGIEDPTARTILDHLIDHPGERLTGEAIQRALGLPEHRAVARATYALGQTAAAMGRKRPWTEGQLGYLMPAAHAALFRQAREATKAPRSPS